MPTPLPPASLDICCQSLIPPECCLPFPRLLSALALQGLWRSDCSLGLEVIRGGRVGFEDNVASLCKKTISDEGSARSSSKRKFLFRQRKELLPCQGVSTLFRFSVITRIPLFPNQVHNFSIKKTQRSWEFSGGCNFAISSLRHWVCFSHTLASRL